MALAQERDGIRALAPGEPLGDAVVLDVRLESEVQAHPLGEPRVVTVSLEQLRRRLDELPPGAMVVVCEKGPRALDAVRMLAGLGREGVRYAAGGRFLRERLA
jgi:rhodanese-related sulfurtransferase